VIRFVHRGGAALIASLLLGFLLAPATSLATTPGWSMTVTSTPDDPISLCPAGIDFCATVNPSAYMKFVVTVSNSATAKSTISKVFLTDTYAATPYSVSPMTGCNSTGELLCSLGALKPGQSATRTIIYQMPSSGTALDFQFEVNTAGVSGSDGGTSHGDTLKKFGHIVLDGSADYVGGYLLNSNDLFTGAVGGQSTKVTPPGAGIGVTIRELAASDTTSPCGSTPVGQLVVLNVADGAVYGTPFETVLTIATSGLPNELTLSQVKLCHKYDDGTAVFLQNCLTDAAPASTPCFWPKWGGPAVVEHESHEVAGGDADDWTSLIIDMWDFQNGSIRGGF